MGGEGGSSSDLLPEGGDTVIEESSAVCQLLLLLLPLSRSIVFTFFFSPDLSHFLCQLVLSSWLSCLWRVLLCPLSLSPLVSDPLTLSLLRLVAFCFNIRSLWASWKCPLGFHAFFLVCQLFPSVQENQEVREAAGVKDPKCVCRSS